MFFYNKPVFHKQSLTRMSHTWERKTALKMKAFAKEMKEICNS